ncbi:MAG: MarR family winged helix-turn-helix transcriptional regulator [Chloroflexota bacterium]
MTDADLSVVQFAILRSLQRAGELPLARIADQQAMERTSLYRTIAPLLDAGAIRLKDASRGKAKIASLTKTGERLIQSTLPHWQRAQSSVVATIGSKQWALLADTLLGIPELLATQHSNDGENQTNDPHRYRRHPPSQYCGPQSQRGRAPTAKYS